MANYLNLVEKVAPLVDERFTAEAYSTGICGNNYDFDGARSIVIQSMGTAPMYDYDRHGTGGGMSRYGTITDLQASQQRMTIMKDRSFTFGVDKGDNLQNNVIEINKALTRQTDEVLIPEYDRYVFNKLASTATQCGNISTTRGTLKGNAKKRTTLTDNGVAYDYFLEAQEWLGDHMVPDEGRVAICSYAMCTALKQDPNFVLATEAGMDIKQKGFYGQVDGVNIIRVPSGRLPVGCGAIISHPYVSVAPRQLEEYKIHDNPLGYSGWVAEGRTIYDCFVLNNKINGIYYIGLDGVSRTVNCVTYPDLTSLTTQKSTLEIQDWETTDKEGNALEYYWRVTTAPVAPAYDHTASDAFNSSEAAVSGVKSAWTKTTVAHVTGVEPVALPMTSPKFLRNFVEVVQINADKDCVGYGCTVLNVYDTVTLDTYI